MKTKVRSEFSPHKSAKPTEFITDDDLISEHAYCALPAHYFDRLLDKNGDRTLPNASLRFENTGYRGFESWEYR